MKKLLICLTMFIFVACNFINDDEDTTSVKATVENPHNFQDGVHYSIIEGTERLEVSDPTKKIILHFCFKMMCGHCKAFYPLVDSLMQHYLDDVEYVKIHSTGKGIKDLHAKMFYLQETVESDDLDTELFNLTAENVGEGLEIEDQIVKYKALFEQYGVSGETFDEYVNSQEAVDRLGESTILIEDLEIKEICPAVVVGGKYRIYTGHFDSDYDILPLIDYLIELSQSEK